MLTTDTEQLAGKRINLYLCTNANTQKVKLIITAKPQAIKFNHKKLYK